MWFPNVSIKKWIKIYPELKEHYPILCKCGNKRKEAIPFVSENWVGIKYEECKCGSRCDQISIPRNKKLVEEIKNILNKISYSMDIKNEEYDKIKQNRVDCPYCENYYNVDDESRKYLIEENDNCIEIICDNCSNKFDVICIDKKYFEGVKEDD